MNEMIFNIVRLVSYKNFAEYLQLFSNNYFYQFKFKILLINKND
jgi:hypothetical protein